MDAKYIILFVLVTTVSCSISKNNKSEEFKYHDIILSKIDTTDYLIAISDKDPNYELGVPFGFVDNSGDTIITLGKYNATWTDTLKTFAIVSVRGFGMMGIDRYENILFEVFRFDNGPDYLKEGLFRVVRNSKIGYANKYGEVVIPCQFDCAFFFENGKAKVANNCKEIKDHKHFRWESKSWYFIDKTGRRVD